MISSGRGAVQTGGLGKTSGDQAIVPVGEESNIVTHQKNPACNGSLLGAVVVGLFPISHYLRNTVVAAGGISRSERRIGILAHRI